MIHFVCMRLLHRNRDIADERLIIFQWSETYNISRSLQFSKCKTPIFVVRFLIVNSVRQTRSYLFFKTFEILSYVNYIIWKFFNDKKMPTNDNSQQYIGWHTIRGSESPLILYQKCCLLLFHLHDKLITNAINWYLVFVSSWVIFNFNQVSVISAKKSSVVLIELFNKV